MDQNDSGQSVLSFILFLLSAGALGVGIIALVQLAELRSELRAMRRRESAPGSLGDVGLPPPVPSVAPASRPSVVQPAAPAIPPIPWSTTPRPTASTSTEGGLGDRLRGLGLLPPRDLVGEYALGAWWAGRLGALVGAAALIFLGIWLNLRNELPAWVRLAELLAVSAALSFAGLRLERHRPDLGRVLGATGLAGFQFAAWAAHHLAGLRVIHDPLTGWAVSLSVTAALVVVALARRSIALTRATAVLGVVQLWVAFGALPGTGASLVLMTLGVVLLGALPLALRGWVSPAALSLLGALPVLHLMLGRAAKSHDFTLQILVTLAVALPVIVAARWSRRSAQPEGKAMVALELAAFLKPVALLQFRSCGGSEQLGIVDGCAAALALGLAWLSRRRGESLAQGCFLAMAAALVGLGIIQFTDDHWNGVVWLGVAGVCLLGAVRLGLAPLRWATEILAAVAAITFCADRPHLTPWLVAIPLLHGILFRLRERAGLMDNLFASLAGMAGLAAVFLWSVGGLERHWELLGWLSPLALAWATGSARLLYAALPAVFLQAYPSAVFGLPISGRARPSAGLLALECATLLVVLGLAVRLRLTRLAGKAREVALALAMLAAAPLLTALPVRLAKFLDLPTPSASAWVLAAALLLGGLELGRRWALGKTLDVLALAFVVPWVILLQHVSSESVGRWSATGSLLAGLFLILLGLHRGRVAIPWATVALAGIAVLCGLPDLPGAWGSLVIGLMAVMVFVAGHLADSRAERVVGLVLLGIASLHVVFNDLSDTFGRIIACAALAAAFFGIAWLYARWARSRAV